MIGLDIFAVVFSTTADAPVLAALEAVAQENDHATALLVDLLPSPVYVGESLVVPEIWPQLTARLDSEFAAERRRLEARCAASPHRIGIRALKVQTDVVGARMADAARYADVTLMRRPEGAHLIDHRRTVFEEVLFGSGRPVMLVPPDWETGAISRHVVIGWAPRREAARALHDAAPFLARAERVTVIAVAPRATHDHVGIQAAEEAASHLARKGIRAAVLAVDPKGREDGDALVQEAGEIGADLIVVGGYGKSRLREFVLGGVTRSLSERSTVPLLLSH